MAEESPLTPLGLLTTQLVEFHVACGGASTSELNRVARTHLSVAAAPGGKTGMKSFSFAAATVSRLLNGVGKRAPKMELLCNFVMANEWYAYIHQIPDWRTGDRRTGPPSVEDLKSWLELRREADAWARSQLRTTNKRNTVTLAVPAPVHDSASVPGPVWLDMPDPSTPMGKRQIAETKPGQEEKCLPAAPRDSPYGPLGLPDPFQSPPPESSDAEKPHPLEAVITAVGDQRLPTVSELLTRIMSGQKDKPEGIDAEQHDEQHDASGLYVGGYPWVADPAPAALVSQQDREETEEETLSPSQQRMRKTFGQEGVALYDQAEEGNLEACHRLGVVLHTDLRPAEADFYLAKAARAHNGDAATLLYSNQQYQLAVTQAYLLGREASAEGHQQAAVMYCTAAARSGHPEAALHLATLMLGLNRNQEADHWYRVAAEDNPPTYSEYGRILRGRRARLQGQSSIQTQPLDMVELFRGLDAQESKWLQAPVTPVRDEQGKLSQRRDLPADQSLRREELEVTPEPSMMDQVPYRKYVLYEASLRPPSPSR